MTKVKVLDKVFRETLTEFQIQERVKHIATQMNRTLEGKKPIFVCILNGAFMFASDLFKQITVEDASITFSRLSSYSGTKTTGKVKQILEFPENLENRTVVIIEDIVDTGITIENTIAQIKKHNPKEVQIATLIYKPESCMKEITLDYIGFEMPNAFIIGYGLDYDYMGRNLPSIYSLDEE